jgi:glutathione S-transferase
MMAIMRDAQSAHPPFAPPFLAAGDRLIAQTANVLAFLGPRHGLAPTDEDGRLFVNQLQLTLADLVDEAHDTHHPVASSLYYEDQKPEAARRAADFRSNRIGKYLGYFERVLAANPGGFLCGARVSTADLSLFQVVEGLRYAFPKTMDALAGRWPKVIALRDAVASRERIAAYLASPRRIPFNEEGVFRRYPELDG